MNNIDNYYFNEESDERFEIQLDEESQEEDTLQEISVEEMLISLVMARPALWDCRLELKERSKTIRDNQWLEIYKEFGEQENLSIAVLMKKWRNLRDTFVRIKGDYDAMPSGSAASKKRKKVWEYYEQMSFLRDTMKFRPSVSNILISEVNQTQPGTSLEVDEQSLNAPSSSGSQTSSGDSITPRKKNETKKVEMALIEAINKINAPVATNNINPICVTISELLSKIPIRERTQAKIELLQMAFSAANKYL